MSNEDTSKMTLVFAPGCFDDFEGTQEELDAMIEQIKAAFESGELLDESSAIDIDELAAEDPEFADFLQRKVNDTRGLH